MGKSRFLGKPPKARCQRAMIRVGVSDFVDVEAKNARLISIALNVFRTTFEKDDEVRRTMVNSGTAVGKQSQREGGSLSPDPPDFDVFLIFFLSVSAPPPVPYHNRAYPAIPAGGERSSYYLFLGDNAIAYYYYCR